MVQMQTSFCFLSAFLMRFSAEFGVAELRTNASDNRLMEGRRLLTEGQGTCLSYVHL
jgi:hypothetical protein